MRLQCLISREIRLQTMKKHLKNVPAVQFPHPRTETTNCMFIENDGAH